MKIMGNLLVFPKNPIDSHKFPCYPKFKAYCVCCVPFFKPTRIFVCSRFAVFMSVFLSTYVNKLDKKGRVSVPAGFRTALSCQTFQGIVAFRSYTLSAIEACGCDVMERLVSQVDHLDMFSETRDDFSSTIFADCEQIAFDSEGRITLSESLITHAHLQGKVAFVGCGSTFQIWEPEAFAAHKDLARKRLRERGAPLSFVMHAAKGEGR